MRKVALTAISVAAAFAFAGQAHGKGLNLRAVCSESGCRDVSGSPELGWSGESTSFTWPSPYYVVRLTGGDAYWLPQSGWLAPEGELQECEYNDCWLRPSPDAESLLRREAAGLEPFRQKLARATVAGKPVADPAPFLALFGKLRWASLPSARLHLTRIVVWPARSNPWINGPSYLGYDGRHQILVRSDGNFRLSRTLWARLNREASATDGDRTGLYAGLGISALAAVALLAGRRSRA